MRSIFSSAAAALSLVPLFTDAAPAGISPVAKRDLKFLFGQEKVRGVNLGGWFVLEPWITPSIFAEWSDNHLAVDEYTLGQQLGYDEAHRRLDQHWSTWITQDDFYKIASKGLNHVRIPIGYWSVAPIQGEPYVQGAYKYLGQSLDWAHAAGIKVLIDLHGAPGSQNGFDNSGRRGDVRWMQGDTVEQTKAALNKIRDDHSAHPAVSAIELVNEPMGPDFDRGALEQFYYDGWGNLYNNNVAITFHDAFLGDNNWNAFGNNLDNWLLDTHHYELFDSQSLEMDIGSHVNSACKFGANMHTNNKWTIAGEWTAAQTDCAKWLNGLGVGARYDGSYVSPTDGSGSYYIGSCDGLSTGTVQGLSAEQRTNLAKFTEAQMDAYEIAEGWIFWTWKTESAPEWDFQALSDAGVIPTPVTNRNYPGQCA